jgi:hypothetical protein
MPVGRYWMVNQLRRVPAPPFMMRLPHVIAAAPGVRDPA